MDNVLEIIVATKDSKQVKVVKFEDLYAIKDELVSIMFLWNANSYYVECGTNTFIINGGRRIQFPEMGVCKIEYRKRTTMQMTLTGNHDARRTHAWLIGIRNKNDENKMLLLEIDAVGATWTWRNAL